jgi:hypothetical protein
VGWLDHVDQTRPSQQDIEGCEGAVERGCVIQVEFAFAGAGNRAGGRPQIEANLRVLVRRLTTRSGVKLPGHPENMSGRIAPPPK